MKVKVFLRVENNSSFVRGKNKSQEEIEERVLRPYDMQKVYPEGGEYILTIPYTTEKELDEKIQDIYSEAEDIADSRHGFIEADIFGLEDPERRW